MSIEEIVKAWKSEEEGLNVGVPASPVGEELTEEELQEVSGGLPCEAFTCFYVDLSCLFHLSGIIPAD
ncbi:MAG: bacteriocin [Ktedonobacteraceae bacterium]|nr:bacteriocin [Ktedonobacteraceae bacterium]MBO0790483.1 bacteriocin [Ktedonobacteraceae bacterium]